MDPEPFAPEVVLDVWFDGRLVQSIPLDPAVFAQGGAPAAGAAGRADQSEHRRNVVVELPAAGPVRLGLELRRPDEEIPGHVRGTTYSFWYDGSGRIAPVGCRRTTTTFLVPSIPPTPSPDDPHVVG